MKCTDITPWMKIIIDNTLIMDKLLRSLFIKDIVRERGNLMFTVTDKASEVIKEFLKDKEANSAIRVLMSMG
ncbi:MAG: hypothetical protein ABFD50_11190 [Smithella sp.]